MATALDTKKIFDDVRSNGYSIIPNYIAKDKLDRVRAEYFQCLSELNIHPQGEKFSPRSLIERPWRKYALGSKSGSGEPYSQILQTTYFSAFDKNYPELGDVFSEMVLIRNKLTGMRDDYGCNFDTDDFWNACRVHHYPQGGGHMAAHRDTLFPKLLSDFEFPFIQLMITLSARGSDFNHGGGYVVNKTGETIFFENEHNAGSLILFDGNTIHGVEDVDPGSLFDVSSPLGRAALFVNLYANFEKTST